jgi:hypothetical protein
MTSSLEPELESQYESDKSKRKSLFSLWTKIAIDDDATLDFVPNLTSEYVKHRKRYVKMYPGLYQSFPEKGTLNRHGTKIISIEIIDKAQFKDAVLVRDHDHFHLGRNGHFQWNGFLSETDIFGIYPHGIPDEQQITDKGKPREIAVRIQTRRGIVETTYNTTFTCNQSRVRIPSMGTLTKLHIATTQPTQVSLLMNGEIGGQASIQRVCQFTFNFDCDIAHGVMNQYLTDEQSDASLNASKVDALFLSFSPDFTGDVTITQHELCIMLPPSDENVEPSSDETQPQSPAGAMRRFGCGCNESHLFVHDLYEDLPLPTSRTYYDVHHCMCMTTY